MRGDRQAGPAQEAALDQYLDTWKAKRVELQSEVDRLRAAAATADAELAKVGSPGTVAVGAAVN